jgi:antitoxin VapB
MKIAKLFKYGRSQAVRLPAEFRFEGNEVLIRRDQVTGDVILSSRNRKFSDGVKLRDHLLPGVPPEELEAIDNLRDAGKHADDVRAKLAEQNLTGQDIADAVASVRKRRARRRQ